MIDTEIARIVYKVHSAVEHPVPVTAQLNGNDVQAMVPGLTIELLDVTGAHGHTVRIVPDGDKDLRARLDALKPGARVTAVFTIEAPADGETE